jgi:hypothetical protein
VRQGVATKVSQGSSSARLELSSRLKARKAEIEKETLIRLLATAGPRELSDVAYLDGLRAAVSAALEYSFAVIESGADWIPQVPLPVLMQARLAARSGVSLQAVLRRYFAGYILLGNFLMQEGSGLLDATELNRLLGTQELVFNRLLDAVTEEHTRELRSRPITADQRLAARIEKLVNGEFVDVSDLGYDINGCHLALVASGAGARDVVKRLSASIDGTLLLVPRGEQIVWAWLGSRRPQNADRVLPHFSKSWPSDLSLAFGEPDHGSAGWRLSHHQARAAISIAVRGPEPIVRYGDVPLLIAALGDETLAESLRRIFLQPLRNERDGGAALRATLRAYFSTGGKSSAAASALGVSRQTVNSHLRAVERHIGRQLGHCAAEVHTALRLEDLGASRHEISTRWRP